MKTTKRLLAFVLAVIVLAVCMISVSVSAAGSMIGFSNKNITVGAQVSVTVTLDAGTAMYGTEADVTYDASLLRFDGGESANGGNGSIHIVGMPAGAAKQSYTLNFTSLVAGNATVSVSNAKYVGDSDSETALSGASATLKINPPVSTAANLSSLKISAGTLSPSFSAGRTAYTATVEYSVEKITVTASGAQGAKIAGTGEKQLSVGDNKITVTVTGTDGTIKSYTITVKRLAEGEKLAADGTIIPTALSTIIDGKDHQVMTTLPETVPAGFEAATTEFNGEQVPIYQSANKEFQLFSIKRLEDEFLEYYVYNSLTDEFEVLEYVTLNDKMFIFADITREYEVPEEYIESTTAFGNGNAKVFYFAEPKMSEFYVFYAFCGGEYGFYRYDTLEKTVQRDPGFNLLFADEVSTQPEQSSIFDMFKNITTQGKLILLTLAVLICSIIAIIILLIIRRAKTIKYENEAIDEDFDLNFDYIDEAAEQLTGIAEEAGNYKQEK